MINVGIVRYWPDLNVAEHECIVRFRQALANLGHGLVEISSDGYRFDSHTLLRPDDVAFVINLHFASPKSYDAVSVAPLWNPVDFYRGFGLTSALANQFSHDFYAETGSGSTQKLLGKMRPDYTAGTPALNHSVPGPIDPAPLRTKLRYFYIGINWEKVLGRPGRYDDVLRALDDEDALTVHGPEALAGGVRPWQGFKGYAGGLPFDGKSVVTAARRAGLFLVFSSSSHRRDSIMSNRLFEAVAAGCVVVSDGHPFIRETLGDLAYEIDPSAPSAETVQRLLEIRAELEADPAACQERAVKTQERLFGPYLLDDQVSALIEFVAQAEVERSKRVYEKVACVLVPPDTLTPAQFGEWLAASPGLAQVERVVVLTDDEALHDHVSRLVNSRHHSIEARLVEPAGDILESPEMQASLRDWVLQNPTIDWIFFATGNERISSDFIDKMHASPLNDVDVVHHASVRRNLRTDPKSDAGSPALAVAAENPFWERALSTFVFRPPILLQWIDEHVGSAGFLSLLMSMDASLTEQGSGVTSRVLAGPTVIVPLRAEGPQTVGELWAATSPDALQPVYLRDSARLLCTRGPQTAGTAQALQRTGSSRFLRPRDAAAAARQAEAATPELIPHVTVSQFEGMTADQKRYVLRMLVDVFPTTRTLRKGRSALRRGSRTDPPIESDGH